MLKTHLVCSLTVVVALGGCGKKENLPAGGTFVSVTAVAGGESRFVAPSLAASWDAAAGLRRRTRPGSRDVVPGRPPATPSHGQGGARHDSMAEQERERSLT